MNVGGGGEGLKDGSFETSLFNRPQVCYYFTSIDIFRFFFLIISFASFLQLGKVFSGV